MTETHHLADEAETLAFGQVLAGRLEQGGVVYLSGDLGAGKTTLVRGILRAFGFTGRVKSPSYGLIESYELDGLTVHHLDLYRLGHGEEIEYLGLEDLFHGPTLLLIEWPEKGQGYLPAATTVIHLADRVDGGRVLSLAKPGGERREDGKGKREKGKSL
ncbi:MAG: tRNA (adenosine(37)-N6)-threonylcarbamoyltransferase complex ATPase subunit type 1 TsaE [Wenzhouxiangella sp.]|nr:MAG: tRNA (adenosine(37)-N6)-threonylcarbamoyltransferase complex ATPase subunit type 1 TsaE [Wenzhouxiangella sp.]